MWNPSIDHHDARVTLVVVLRGQRSTSATLHDAHGRVLAAQTWPAVYPLTEVADRVRELGLRVGAWSYGEQGDAWATLTRWNAREVGVEGGWEKDAPLKQRASVWAVPAERLRREAEARALGDETEEGQGRGPREPVRTVLEPMVAYSLMPRAKWRARATIRGAHTV